MAKLFSSEVAVRIANETLQVHGGHGLSRTIRSRNSIATSSCAPSERVPARSNAW